MLAEAEEPAAPAEPVGGRIAARRAARRWPRHDHARGVDEQIERRVDIARLAKQGERKLRREPVTGERVQAAPHERVAVRRALRLALRDLEEVAALVDRGLALEILDLDRVQSSLRLLVLVHDLLQVRLARDVLRRRPARDYQVLQRLLRQLAGRDDDRLHPAEEQIEEVVAGVDRGEADADRQ